MKNLLDNINSLLPSYTTILPFSNKEVKFTPFKVKNAKNISIILQEDNKNLSLKAMVDLLRSCSSGIDPLELCLADAEYLFISIRAKSVEENLNLIVNGEPIQVNIFDIKTRNNLISTQINVSPSLILKIETPKIKDLIKLSNITKKDLLLTSIKQVVSNQEIYNVDTFINKDMEELLNNLPLSVLNELEKIRHPELYLNLKTDSDESEVSGFLTFFTFP